MIDRVKRLRIGIKVERTSIMSTRDSMPEMSIDGVDKETVRRSHSNRDPMGSSFPAIELRLVCVQDDSADTAFQRHSIRIS